MSQEIIEIRPSHWHANYCFTDHKKSSSSSQNHAVKHDSPQRSCCASKESHENDASISSTQLFYSFNTWILIDSSFHVFFFSLY